MHGWADFGFWRDRRKGLGRNAEEGRFAREARRGKEAARGAEKGPGVEVRWGLEVDDGAIAELFELNGMPRWVAFEERFVVAEEDGRLVAALRYRTEPKRLILGLPVVDPYAGGHGVVAALYGGAVELARGIGVDEVVARPTGVAKEAQTEYLDDPGRRQEDPLPDAAQMAVVRELPPGGWRRIAALFGVAAVPFSRAFRD